MTFLLAAGNVEAAPTAESDDPSEPGRAALRWRNQIGETRFHAAALFSTPVRDGGGEHAHGVELGYTMGMTPGLRRFRIGGAYGILARAIDDKTFLLAPYYELGGGFRYSVAEIYAFAGVAWFELGAAHAKVALGLLSPRAGIVVGSRISEGLALHAFVATEYNWGVLGYDDFRTQLFGLRLTFLTPPADDTSAASP